MIGEKRLKEIQARLRGVLAEVSPESAGEYDISYGNSREAESSPRDPAYGLFLTLKSNPQEAYEILHVFESDIRQPIPKNLERYYGGSAFADRVREGVEKLQKHKHKREGKPGKLETLGIISLSAILILFIFFSRITGNAIGVSNPMSRWIGTGLFIGVVVVAAVYLIKKSQ